MIRLVRMGIDVGGTHIKAVAIDNNKHEILGKSSVKTTHNHKRGVAAGVVESFVSCMEDNKIDPNDVIFVAHSTTQATNALLEGDVANVGVFGVGGGGLEGFLAKKQSYIDDIDLGTGKEIKVFNVFEKKKKLNEELIIKGIKHLNDQGAEVIVSSMAFGVDNDTEEKLISNQAVKMNLPTTCASEITKLYGLTRRTRTAAINASILPKMLETAISTESSVREAGVQVPLMIMRGDGGVMDVSEMKKRPILTMLSGPAASVMGSLMYLRASNGVYFEVGGTSTNIGVIKNGRPAIDYAVLGGHSTFVNSLDVRVLGVAGGSMVRLGKNAVKDVGPRSAHIAGLDYSLYTEAEIEEAQLEFFSPKLGDPDDYVRIRLKNGKCITVTNSCAANILGLVKPEHFSYGDVKKARKAMKPLADYLNTTVEDVSEQIMERSLDKIKPTFEELIEKHGLEHDQIYLVGVGGGAAALIIYFATKLNLKYNIPENAEVISSIGVALSMVRDVVERIIPNPTKQEIKSIKQEALDKAIESGASPDTIDVHIEIDSQTSKVTAIATGSTEVKTTDLLKECDLNEATEIANNDFGNNITNITLAVDYKYFYIFSGKKGDKEPIRILDKKGFIKVQRSDARAVKCKAQDYLEIVKEMWNDLATFKTDALLRPDFYLCIGPKLMDFSVQSLDQLIILIDLEIASLELNDEIVIVGAFNDIN